MAERIQSNSEGASSLAGTIKDALSGYLGFKIESIELPAPVSGSYDHDSLSSGIAKALESWEMLIDSDAHALIITASDLEGADSSAARMLMGISGETA